MIKIQAFGAYGDNTWDDEGQSEISQIFLSEDRFFISCIQFQYVQNGTRVLSQKYGACHGPRFRSIKLNYPSKFLTRVKGKFRANGVTLIPFITNLQTYEPYGYDYKDERQFDFDMGEDRQFGGFHGTLYYSRLGSLGVYVKSSTDPSTEQTQSSHLYGTRSSHLDCAAKLPVDDHHHNHPRHEHNSPAFIPEPEPSRRRHHHQEKHLHHDISRPVHEPHYGHHPAYRSRKMKLHPGDSMQRANCGA